MKATLTLAIALFLASAPNPDESTRQDVYQQFLTPVLSATEAVVSPAHATAPAVIVEIEPKIEADTENAVAAATVAPAVPWLEPLSVKGRVSADWVFLDSESISDEWLAQVDHGPIPHALRAGASSLKSIVEE